MVKLNMCWPKYYNEVEVATLNEAKVFSYLKDEAEVLHIIRFAVSSVSSL